MDSKPLREHNWSELRLSVVGYALVSLAALLYIVSTATPHWISGPVSLQIGLFVVCSSSPGVEDVCGSVFPVSVYVHITRFCMISACIIGCVTIIAPAVAYSGKVAQIGKNEVRKTAHAVLVAASLVVIGTIAYTIGSAVNDFLTLYKLDYSIVLAWLAAIAGYVGGGMLESQFREPPSASTTIMVMPQQTTAGVDQTTGHGMVTSSPNTFVDPSAPPSVYPGVMAGLGGPNYPAQVPGMPQVQDKR